MVISVNHLSIYGAVADMIVEIRQFFFALIQEKYEINLYAENIRCLEIKKELVSKGGSKAMYDLAPSRTSKFAITTEDTVLKFRFNLCFKIKPYLGFEFWTVLTNLSEEPCRSKRNRKLAGNPLQKRDQCGEAPSGLWRAFNLWCTGTSQGINDAMTSVPFWVSIALQSSSDKHFLWLLNAIRVILFSVELLPCLVLWILILVGQKMDWHWNTGIKWSILFSSVEIHHSTTMTQSNSSSRRWWSSPLWPSCWWMQEKSNSTILDIGQTKWRGFSSMLSIGRLKNGYQFWQEVEEKEEFSILFESELSSSILVFSSNPRTFRKYYQSCITSETEKNWGQWWTMVWFQEEPVSEQADKLCYSSLLWIRWIINMVLEKETLCDLSQARIAHCKHILQYLQNTLYWCNLMFAQQRRLQFYQTGSNLVNL